MEESTKAFIKKIKINTYIYTFIFMAVGVMYTAKQEISLEPFMLLLAAFAFYTLGRQVLKPELNWTLSQEHRHGSGALSTWLFCS